MSNVDDNNTTPVASSDHNHSNGSSSTNNNVTHVPNHTLKSARSAILFTKNAAFQSKTTLTLWLLNRMFEPIDPNFEHEGLSFLEISNNALSSIPNTPTVAQQQETENKSNETATTTTKRDENGATLLTPRTRILSISNEYCMVVMVDLSSSLATTDVGRGNIMIDNINDALRNVMLGLAQPISMPTAGASPPFIPVIRLTVIAECSQFGSNINVIPILAEFPTMRVFLQNVRVTPSNVSSILRVLNDNIAGFLRDLAAFRQKLTKRRSKLGYELDVRRNHSSVIMDHGVDDSLDGGGGASHEGGLFNSTYINKTTTTATMTTKTQEQQPSQPATTQAKTTTTNRKKDQKTHKDGKSGATKKTKNTKTQANNTQKSTNTTARSFNSSNTRHNRSNDNTTKKDVWGVGKTGSNLSYILHAGLLALGLLPDSGQRSLILMTDGVVKSNIQDEFVIRQLSSDGIPCNIVQISPGPFMDCNFGFIPDTDILKFVANATGGQYMHIEDLLGMGRMDAAYYTNNNTSNKPIVTQDILDRIMADLSFPQRKFLLREIFLDKSALRTGSTATSRAAAVAAAAEKAQQGNYLAMASAAASRNGFPWNPNAEPEVTESKVLRYQEYALPSKLSHVIAARTRQGFSLVSITLDKRRSTTPLNSSSSRGGGGAGGGKKVQVVIALTLQWQPQITIEYRIRAVLSSNNDLILSSYFGTGTIFEDHDDATAAYLPDADFSRLLESLTNPKAEILIRANSTFSHLLRNWDAFQRRFQVMGIFTGGAGTSANGAGVSNNLSGSAGILKISKLKQLLTSISEADKHLNTILSLGNDTNGHSRNNNIINSNNGSRRNVSPSSYIAQFQELWQKMDDSSDTRHSTACWYDTNHHFDLILHFTPHYCYADRNSTATTAFIASAEDAVISTILDRLYDLLSKMTDFVSSRGTFVKIFFPSPSSNHSTSQQQQASNCSNNGNYCRLYEIQITHENLRTIHVDARFFNTPLEMRSRIMDDLMHMLSTRIELDEGQILADLEIGQHPLNNNVGGDSGTRPNMAKIEVAKRPLFGLLMRDPEHYFGVPKEREDGYDRRRPTTATLLAGEYIVRNYLRRQRWIWDAKVTTTTVDASDFYGLHPLHDLAFERLCHVRLKEGYVLISFSENACHFYKEFQDRAPDRSAQYFIWRNSSKQTLTTELWLEPVTRDVHRIDRDIVQTEQRRLFHHDRKIMSKLVTFDWTFVAGYQQQRGISPPSSSLSASRADVLHLDDDLLGIHHIKKSMVIDITSVLRLSAFSIAVYPCPQQLVGTSNNIVNMRGALMPPTYNDEGTAASDIIAEAQKRDMAVVWLQTERYLPLVAPPANSRPKIEESHSRSWHGSSNNTTIASPSISLVRGGSYSYSNQSSTCQCPRPDHDFLLFREALSDLSAPYRDVALTHYYFQQYLRVLSDCEMDTKSPLTATHDSFWSTFFREILGCQDTHASESTLRLLRRVTDMQCFVKIFNPSTFIVVLTPSLATLIHGTATKRADDPLFTDHYHLGFLLFECHRQTPSSTTTARGGDHCYDEEDNSSNNDSKGYTFREIDFSSIKESILSPHLTNGYYQCNNNSMNAGEGEDQQQVVLSDFKSRLLQDITDIYSSCYAKSIYSSLLFGSVIADHDFDKVLDICEETVLDIDLTGYLNVQTLLKRHGRTSVEEWNSAQQRFSSVLEHYFEPVMYSKKKRQFIYCYRPAHVKIGHHKAETGNKLTRLADIVVSAQCPLFIRLEYTLQSPKHAASTTLPLEYLPTSYEGQHKGQPFNYEPVDIGSMESPVASVDKSSATVRLVCMTIPQTKYAPAIQPRHVHGCPAESPVHHQSSFFDNEGEYREALSGLSEEKQGALIETKARLTWLLTEEVMHGLLRAGPVTDVVVRYIQSHLMKKNPFVDFPTTMVIPLVFVKDRHMSRRVFLEQLERNTMTPYKLVRVGDCFYATDHKEYGDIFDTGESYFNRSETMSNNHEGADFYTDLGIEVDADKEHHHPFIPQQQPTHQQQQQQQGGSQNDDFCEGLGISIMEPDVFSDEEDSMAASNVADRQAYQQLYWLLIIPRSQTIQIYFYSKMPQSVNRSEIVRMTKVMINDAIERTNKLVLLQHLNATRVCSKYLLANEGSAANNPNEISTDESSDDSNGNNRNSNSDRSKLRNTTGGNLVEMLSTSGEETSFTPPKKFQPGQFACDIIFTWRFPLHWRLQPNIALNALSSDVLRHFKVRNRPNIFVCMRDDTVIYCTLRENTVINHCYAESSIDYPSAATDDGQQQQQQSIRATSPHNSLLAMGINDPPMMAFSHHSRTQSAQPTTAAYSQPQHDGSAVAGTITTNNSSRRTSPRSSPGGKVHSTNSIQLSPEPRKTARTSESRELVLEVYGVDLPNWISDELVDLLENRLMSHVTLKEVQQFLLRNPGSKLSRADIDFILPVDKAPMVHESLQVPVDVIDVQQFSRLLRESVLTNSIRVLTGNGLTSALKNYRLRQHYSNLSFGKGPFFMQKESNVDNPVVEELCFYYSCINRTPGVCTDLELSIGQGVAGVILSFSESSWSQEEDFQNPSDSTDGQDSAMPWSLLSSFASKSACVASEQQHQQQQQQRGTTLSVDIWTVGQVDAGALYDHIHKSFRQSICDYIIERAVSSAMPTTTTATTSVSGDGGSSDLAISDAALSALLSSFVKVFDGAYHWSNPSVHMASRSIKLQPWCLSQVVQQLNADFVDLNPNSKSVIGIQSPTSDDYHHQLLGNQTNIYRACYTETELNHQAQAMMQPQKNIRYSIISGLHELSGCKHYYSTSTKQPEFTSITDDPPNRGDTVATILRADQNSAHSRHESIASSNVVNNNNSSNKNPISKLLQQQQQPKSGSHKDATHRRAFHLVLLDAGNITLYTYNYARTFVDQLTLAIEQTVAQQGNRVRMLQNVVHQKLGLFQHSETLGTICNDARSFVTSVTEDDSTFGVEILKNLVTNTPHLNSYSATEHPGRPSLSTTSSATRLSNPKISTLISGAVTFHPSSNKLLKDCNTALRDAYTTLPDHPITEAAAAEEEQQLDYLTQHGTPFLSTFMRHSQLRAAHDKAFNVYIKWASRYSTMQPSETTKERENASEMMSVTELRLILKSSRLLHFCRTPLVFSDIDPKRSSIFSTSIETIQQHQLMEETMMWYEGLARTFMAEYASYLESVGMHVIVHGVSGNSNTSKEDQGVYLSRYKVADDFVVHSPVIYLLQVFPGGTIMCEARLTDVFVSVTLYTLHRRYGRLMMTQSPYMHESSEKRRADFKDFTEECDRFKQKIHVNSFVYDFNLKFIQQSLDNASSLPSSVDLLGIIKNTFSLYYKPANYSRNRIIRGFYELVSDEEEDNMKNLLPMVIRNASKYGFESLHTNGTPTACFVSSDDPSFVKGSGDGNSNSCYRYTLLITDNIYERDFSSGSDGHPGRYDYPNSPIHDIATTPTSTSDSKVTVQYFVIVTYHEPEIYRTKEKSWRHSPRYKPRNLSGSLQEVLEPEKHTLGDVILRARQRIDDLMKQVNIQRRKRHN
ncbi:hypothetical protein BDB00DRAFT_59186 [Zychaea mexicana]|uniref:uncharacterized protein n=1 Tax=Zychaea mexicana TaxID=64656 RepID=UPI0022FE0350|nr:uncharacterized protein BDB00DRAFT_59186 [Zychaea mexicana]KAI9488244.1 hypothetical protein BDB00DRAFT_59186 [Zychaea mexicana]